MCHRSIVQCCPQAFFHSHRVPPEISRHDMWLYVLFDFQRGTQYACSIFDILGDRLVETCMGPYSLCRCILINLTCIQAPLAYPLGVVGSSFHAGGGFLSRRRNSGTELPNLVNGTIGCQTPGATANGKNLWS